MNTRLLYGELFRLETGGPVMFSVDPVIPELASAPGWRLMTGLRPYDVMVMDVSNLVTMGIFPLYSDPPRAIQFAYGEVDQSGALIHVTRDPC